LAFCAGKILAHQGKPYSETGRNIAQLSRNASAAVSILPSIASSVESSPMPFLKRRSENVGKSGLKGIIATGATLGVFSIPLESSAFEPADYMVYSKGAFSVRPQLRLFSEYNDNIFYRKLNVESDWINTVSPGIRMLLGEDLPTVNHINLQYFLDQSWYFDNAQLDALQHHIDLAGRYSTGRTTLTGSDSIGFLSTTLGGGFSAAGLKVDRTIYTDFYRLEYRVGERTEVYGEVDHSAVDYQDRVSLFDVRTIQGALGFGWRYSEDARIFGEAYYGQTGLESNVGRTDPPGKTFVGGFIGARGQFTEKLSGVLKAGYEVNEFEETTLTTVNTSAGSSPVVEASLTFQATTRTSATFSYSRRQRVSVEFVRSAYTSDEIRLGAGMILGQTGRLRLNAGANFGAYDYEPSPSFASRTDMRWGGSLSASWFFETWLSARLSYDFSQYMSDLPQLVDYQHNRIMLGLSVGY
jgi:hypothetical protein